MSQRVEEAAGCGSLGVEGATLQERYQEEPCSFQRYQAQDTQALVTLELACCNRKVTHVLLCFVALNPDWQGNMITCSPSPSLVLPVTGVGFYGDLEPNILEEGGTLGNFHSPTLVSVSNFFPP